MGGVQGVCGGGELGLGLWVLTVGSAGKRPGQETGSSCALGWWELRQGSVHTGASWGLTRSWVTAMGATRPPDAAAGQAGPRPEKWVRLSLAGGHGSSEVRAARLGGRALNCPAGGGAEAGGGRWGPAGGLGRRLLVWGSEHTPYLRLAP